MIFFSKLLPTQGDFMTHHWYDLVFSLYVGVLKFNWTRCIALKEKWREWKSWLLWCNWGVLFLGDIHVTILNLRRSLAQGLQDSHLALQELLCLCGQASTSKAPQMSSSLGSRSQFTSWEREFPWRAYWEEAGKVPAVSAGQPRPGTERWPPPVWSCRTGRGASAAGKGRSESVGPQVRSSCSRLCPWSRCLISCTLALSSWLSMLQRVLVLWAVLLGMPGSMGWHLIF